MTDSDHPYVDPDNVAQAQAALVNEATAAALGNLFKTLADPTRVRMICALANTELCVNDLTAILGMEQSAVSHQLQTLRRARLVKYERRGRLIYYSLDDDHVRDLLTRSLEHIQHG